MKLGIQSEWRVVFLKLTASLELQFRLPVNPESGGWSANMDRKMSPDPGWRIGVHICGITLDVIADDAGLSGIVIRK